jgi:hypothetical protein
MSLMLLNWQWIGYNKWIFPFFFSCWKTPGKMHGRAWRLKGEISQEDERRKKGSLSYHWLENVIEWRGGGIEVTSCKSERTLIPAWGGGGRLLLCIGGRCPATYVRTRTWTAAPERLLWIILADGWLFNCHSVFVWHQWQLCCSWARPRSQKKRRWKTERKQRPKSQGDEEPKRSSVINHRYAQDIYKKQGQHSTVGRETQSRVAMRI